MLIITKQYIHTAIMEKTELSMNGKYMERKKNDKFKRKIGTRPKGDAFHLRPVVTEEQ